VVTPEAFGSVANALLPFSGMTIFLSGIVAGWLMVMVVWLVAASRYTMGQFLIVWLLTMAIGFGPFHHCILGTTEVLSALFLGEPIAITSLLHFLGWTTVGNIIGGGVFVALLNYGQSAKAGNPKDVDISDQNG
jgi:formate/nitrite transporter FocA (FNT family)